VGASAVGELGSWRERLRGAILFSRTRIPAHRVRLSGSPRPRDILTDLRPGFAAPPCAPPAGGARRCALGILGETGRPRTRRGSCKGAAASRADSADSARPGNLKSTG
jgi:hypothetical protein